MKRSEEKKVMSGIELSTSDAPGHSFRFTTRPHGAHKKDVLKFYY